MSRQDPRRSSPAWFPVIGLGLAVGGLLSLAACAPRGAAHIEEGAGRAALIVVHGDGRQKTACVRFSEPAISGLDLLLRSGLSAVVDESNPSGALVCSIGGEGCAFPSQTCLCQCSSPGQCGYWAYFQRRPPGGWTYSVQGASDSRLGSGDTDSWVWIQSTSPSESPRLPPDLPFDAICQ